LAPAACLSIFAAHADRTITAPLTITTLGSCGRYESGAGHSSTRLWSFLLREIVYIGDFGAVRRFRDGMLTRMSDLARDLGLPAMVMSANDPFFSKDRGDLTTYQTSLDLKYELCGRLAGTDAGLAVGSVNLHNQHFGTSFGIKLADGTPASSACVGFGLDRWARWLLPHIGADPRNWPEVLRAS
jgi:seryl-tRNA synthetase